ncbi:MAG: alpha-amylase family protein [Thermoflexibacteraceae bacterium]
MKFSKSFLWVYMACVALYACQSKQTETAMDKNDIALLKETPEDHKLIVYQIFTRLFGNKKTNNKKYGTIEENGVGKFNDITDTALVELKKMGITHVWYTGVLEHATMTNYTRFGIPLDDADVVKGRAGSPYAIKDYYDVCPDFAEDVPNRMKEFEALLKRTHDNGLKVIIDFVPNHVARKYKSDAKPAGIKDFGEEDNKNVAFSPQNNFYYILNSKFVVPKEYKALGDIKVPTKDGMFAEAPAKATGNDVFSATPSVNDWFETVKLNYGVDYANGMKGYFEPVPNTWQKMYEILDFWAGKGVDAFRCDMAQMVPVEFWGWVIPKVQAKYPKVFFIAEIYEAHRYRDYIEKGKFTYLYDKVGLYDTIRHLIEGRLQSTDSITQCWRYLTGINKNMIRFLENHDEQRIGSEYFGRNGSAAKAGMVVSATIWSSPVMIYFGQEVGEKGDDEEGFAGNDGRTTIFDYWGVKAHQAWMNNGKFDGGQLSPEQKNLRQFYSTLLNLCNQSEAIRKGELYNLHFFNTEHSARYSNKLYSYLRFTNNQKVVVVANFDVKPVSATLKVPANAFQLMGLSGVLTATDLLGSGFSTTFNTEEVANTKNKEKGISLTLQPNEAVVLELK